VENTGDPIIPFFFRTTVRERRIVLMTAIFVLLTVMTCVGIKLLAKRIRQTHTAEERRVRRVRWGLTEEAFSKC
jgi:hypothetical protein